MKYIFTFCISFILSLNLTANEPLTGTMAVLTDGIVDAKRKDAIIAFTILINRIGFKNNLIGDLKYYNSQKKILDDYLDNKIDYIIINPYYYLIHQKNLEKQTAFYWSIRRYKNKFQKMIIVTNIKSGINTINDLSNKTIILKEDNYMGKIVLNKVILKSKHREYQGYVKKVDKTLKHSTAILKTYFEKADVAIVPMHAYNLVCEMNPIVGKKLKIIYQTDHLFMPMLNLINISTSKEILKRMKKTSNSLHLTKEGQSIFSLFRISGIDVITVKELEPLIQYYQEYIILKKRYGY